MFKALPLRQFVALRNRGVRVVGSFNQAEVCSGLVCHPLANAGIGDNEEAVAEAEAALVNRPPYVVEC